MYPTLTATPKVVHGLAVCKTCRIWVCLACHVCPPARPDYR